MTAYQADRLAVQDVMLKYAACVDERDDEGYRALFTDDVEVAGMAAENIHGINAYFPWWLEAVSQYEATQHLLSPTRATIDGDHASTRTDVQATHFLDQGGTTLILWATYKTDMRRVDGKWKICRHELVRRGLLSRHSRA